MLNFLKVFALSIVFLTGTVNASDINIKNIEKIRKSIVSINSRVPVSAYKNPGSWIGTGFLVDGKNGLLVTNNHVVGRASIGTYFATFHNGQQAEAKLVYYDMYADFAIMRVDSAELPVDFEIVEFTDDAPKLGAKVFIVGNTEGQGFSFHDGYLSDLFEISGEMPQGSYVINMNSTGGASGSPILNADNKAIGVLYGGGKTHSLALKGAYIQHVLKELNSDREFPNRKHIGIITQLTSLDKAVKHRSFPKNEMDKYLKDFPDARNRAIIVRSTLPGGTAESLIKPGDIIWQVDGKQIGADLCMFDLLLSQTKNDKAIFTIFRDGKKIEQEIALYDLNNNKISRMLDFAGGLFFQADDYISAKAGVPLGSVVLANVQTGSSFSSIPEMFVQDYKNLYRIQIKTFNGDTIKSLDDLIFSMNKAIKQKYINIEYQNYLPYSANFGGDWISAQEHLMQDITFDSIDNKPRVLKFDNVKSEWLPEEM